MTPLEFLKEKNLFMADVARSWGIVPSTLFRYVHGLRWPSALAMIRFHELSRGKVRLEDWIETCRVHLTDTGVLKHESGSDGTTWKTQRLKLKINKRRKRIRNPDSRQEAERNSEEQP